MIDARALDIHPRPNQGTSHPGCWAVQLKVMCAGTRRTFWHWYTDRSPRHGTEHAQQQPKPKHVDVLLRFWNDTFTELHGFAFNKAAP